MTCVDQAGDKHGFIHLGHSHVFACDLHGVYPAALQSGGQSGVVCLAQTGATSY